MHVMVASTRVKHQLKVEQIIADRIGKDGSGTPEYLVKLQGLFYAEATYMVCSRLICLLCNLEFSKCLISQCLYIYIFLCCFPPHFKMIIF
ncbi:hypothetical protein L1987_40570 [Smallanthus sonchifolius]|uniref:Uncharacterized protein n=1 Tax=Smallanthus sonchifolius TaxID=185202 RepID=A0ACB9GUI5_9ASTR|nr:hypothetical protein L1987_40570 [Smallanthus sonchifolius]